MESYGDIRIAYNKLHTQSAIDRKQTLIAFEDMYVWGPSGQMGRHTFYKNNEMAGYDSWQQNETIRQAINIDAGVIKKQGILLFQNRETSYPHTPKNIDEN